MANSKDLLELITVNEKDAVAEIDKMFSFEVQALYYDEPRILTASIEAGAATLVTKLLEKGVLEYATIADYQPILQAAARMMAKDHHDDPTTSLPPKSPVHTPAHKIFLEILLHHPEPRGLSFEAIAKLFYDEPEASKKAVDETFIRALSFNIQQHTEHLPIHTNLIMGCLCKNSPQYHKDAYAYFLEVNKDDCSERQRAMVSQLQAECLFQNPNISKTPEGIISHAYAAHACHSPLCQDSCPLH